MEYPINEKEGVFELLIPKEEYKPLKKEDLDEKLRKEKEEELKEGEEKIINLITDYLKSENFEWKASESKDYKFQLPKTAFNEAKQFNIVNYNDEEVVYEDNENQVLSEQNLHDIALKGEFSIKSSKQKEYVWKLSTWLMQGSENRFKNWERDMSIAFEMFYYYKYRFNSKFKYANLYRVIKNFYYTLRDFSRLIFGTPFIKENNEVYSNKVYGDYYEKLLKEVELNTEAYYPNAHKILGNIQTDFNEEWKNTKYIYEEEFKRDETLDDSTRKIKLIEKRLEKLIEYFTNHKEFNSETGKIKKEIQEVVIKLIKARHILLQIDNEHYNKVDLMKKKLMEEIKEKHSIKSRINPWLNKAYFTEEKIRILELENERKVEILAKFKDYPLELQMITSWEDFEKQRPSIIKALREESEVIPRRTFRYYFSYCTPIVEKNEYEDMETKQKKFSYYLKYNKNINVFTSNYFWRWSRMFYWQILMIWEVLIWYKKANFQSSVGISALWGTEIENYRTVNSSTGEVTIQYNEWSFPNSYKKLGNWISESRENFLKNKDTNFFGPSFGNFINVLENYFFKAVVLGFLNTVFYPIVILLWTVLSFVLMILGIIASTLIIIIVSLFNILIWDTDYPGRFSCNIFPLFVLIVWRIGICIIFSFLFFVFLCLIQFFWGIFMFLFSFIRFISRRIYDAFTYSIITCLAKVPKTDSSVAWKIKGPGINRGSFYRISIEDALTLLRSQLEKNHLEYYKQKMNETIDSPIKFISKFNDRVMSRVYCNMSVNNSCTKTCSNLKMSLEKQINERHKIFPNSCYNLKFTEEDLEVFLIASQDLIKDYVEEEKLHKWIWKHYMITENSWDLLTEKILQKCFGENILENIDDGVEMIESKQKDKEIANAIRDIQQEANIVNIKSMALKKRQKLANKYDVDDLETLELSHKYLQPRKHTSMNRNYDDSNQREARIECLYSEANPFKIDYMYIPEERRNKELKIDGKLNPKNEDDCNSISGDGEKVFDSYLD